MYNNNFMLDKLSRQKEEIENLMRNYQQPMNVFNVGGTQVDFEARMIGKDEELAKEIVEDMKPLGEYWNIETIKNVIGNDNHRLEDMYVVMNSLANDYQAVINLEEANTYINMAHAWLDDVDACSNKVWWYFVK